MAIASQHSASSVADTIDYLLHGHQKVDPESRVGWTASRNLAGLDDPETVRKCMEATAELRDVQVEQPYYHVAISFHVDDRPRLSQARMEQIAEEVLSDLGLSEHQVWLVGHKDTGHPHFHMLVSRIHPETGKAWSRWQDRARMQRSLRGVEQRHGLKEVRGWLYGEEPEVIAPARTDVLRGQRSTSPTFVAELQAQGVGEVLKTSRSWGELESRLSVQGLVLQRAGRGLQVTDGERVAKVSALHRGSSLARLESRFSTSWSVWCGKTPQSAHAKVPKGRGERSRVDGEVYRGRAQVLEQHWELYERRRSLRSAYGKISSAVSSEEASSRLESFWREDLGERASRAYRDPESVLVGLRDWLENPPGELSELSPADRVEELIRRLWRSPESFGKVRGWWGTEGRKSARRAARVFTGSLRRWGGLYQGVGEAHQRERLASELSDLGQDPSQPVPSGDLWTWLHGIPASQLSQLPADLQARVARMRREDLRIWEALSTAERVGEGEGRSRLPRLEDLGRATFTKGDVRALVSGREDSESLYARLMGQCEELGRDGRGRMRYASRAYLASENELVRRSTSLMERRGSGPGRRRVEAALERWAPWASEAQREVIAAAANGPDLALILGRPGTGKTDPVAKVLAEAYRQQGREVQGVALAGKAAAGLSESAGIPARTFASWELGGSRLPERGVLLVDEAGMLNTGQLASVLRSAEAHRASVVLIGDPDQLEAIGPGDGFRLLIERHGASELTEIRRQKVAWQREASSAYCRGEISAAFEAYRAADQVQAYADAGAATRGLIGEYLDGFESSRSALVLASTNLEVVRLNAGIREGLRARGLLRAGGRWVVGDRVVFVRNNYALDYRNGSFGRVVRLSGDQLTVELDTGREVQVSRRSGDLRYGYASTIHRAQGVTVDRTYLLLGGYLDRHRGLVGWTRHRKDLRVYWDRETYRDTGRLVSALSRGGTNDLVRDYLEPDVSQSGLERAGEVLRAAGLRWAHRVPPRIHRRVSPGVGNWLVSAALSTSQVVETLDLGGPRGPRMRL